jgi:hypothetical protein
MKKFTFGVAVLLGVSLFFIGCAQEAEETVKWQNNDVPTPFDRNVATDAALKAALDEDGVTSIGFLGTGSIDLVTSTNIPAGKKVAFYSTVVSKGLDIEGTVYVGSSGSLTAAASTGEIVVKGSLVVLDGGTLSTDVADSVNDGDVQSVLDTGKVSVASGGTLVFPATALTDQTKIETALGYAGSGTLSITGAVASLKPEELAAAAIGKSATLVATAGTNAGAVALVIPANAEITVATGDTVASTSVEVSGKLTLDPGSTLAAATSVTSAGTGKIVSTTVTPAVLSALLTKAGSALTLEQNGAVALVAATTVQAGTTLVLGAALTVESHATTKALTVAGTVEIGNSGSIVTAGTHDGTGDIIITGTGYITAGGIVVSGEGSVNFNTVASGLSNQLGVGTLTLADATTLVLDGTQIQAGGANGITFMPGSYVGGNSLGGFLTVTDGKATLALPDTASALAIGNTVASELVFGSASTYKVAGTTGTLTPGATTTASADVKLTFHPGAKIVAGNGTASGSGTAIKTTGDVNAADTTWTLGGSDPVTVTKTATASTWSSTIP